MNNEQLIALENYARLEGTEYGESILAIIALYAFNAYFEDEFNAVLINKMRESLEYFKDNYVVVSEEYIQVVDSLEFVGS